MKDERPVPKWALISPLLLSLLLSGPQLWGLEACPRAATTCRDIEGFLGWATVVFPHSLVLPLVLAAPNGWQVLLAALDIAVIAVVWLTQPPRVSWSRAGWILLAWIGSSALTVFFEPYLVVWLIHHTA